MRAPEISVVVASHERPLRLRWLLNALQEQTLQHGRWEVVVAHDSSGSETEQLLRTHPLARLGVLRHLTFAPGPGPAPKRNAAWRAASAAIVAFTDDDCRPPPEWLERALAAARDRPGTIVQGSTRPDPDELVLAQRAPHALTQTIDPPVPWAQTCNIVYPREVLEYAGGFDEELPWVEDADLAARAIAGGVPYAGAPEMLTYHAVHVVSLRGRLRAVGRWDAVVELVRRHPGLRRHYPAGLFWKETHGWLLLLLAGAAVSHGPVPIAALALPWVRHAAPAYGAAPRGWLRAALELPGRALIDLVEIATLARGSGRHRTLFL